MDDLTSAMRRREDRRVGGSGLESEAKSSSLFYIVYLGGADSAFIDRAPYPHNASARTGWRRQSRKGGWHALLLVKYLSPYFYAISPYVWRKISEPRDHKFAGPCMFHVLSFVD